MPDFAVYVRVFNILLVLAYFSYMVVLRGWWATRPREERIILISHPILLLVTAYASIEGLVQGLSAGARVFLYTPSLILCLFGLVTLNSKIRYFKKREEEDNDREG